jgi:radical SAM-linked protein
MTEDALTRYRIHFCKEDRLRYIGHLDLNRAMERTLRRARLPLGYSKGFNPRVKLNLSSALPLGCSSSVELADIWLLNEVSEDVVLESLRAVSPPGLTVSRVEVIDLKTPSLQSQIKAFEYQVALSGVGDPSILPGAITALLEAESLPRTRRGKAYDLRPLIQALHLNRGDQDSVTLRMVLQAGEGSTGRPEEVLLALGLDPADTLIERTRLFLEAETSIEN